MRTRAIALLMFAAACGGTTDPPISEGGTYQLTAVDGKPLPFFWSAGIGGTASITNGTLVMDAARHEFTETHTQTSDSPSAGHGVGTSTISGTYTIAGNAIAFTIVSSVGTGVLPGQFGPGPVVTIAILGRAYRFERP